MGTWSWPVSPVYVTSPWDPARKHPVTHIVKPHTGTDFRAHDGAHLYAVHDGRVVRSVYDPAVAGNYVRIDCGGGVWAGYSHLSERLVRVNDRVRRGQLIGRAGSTGSATAAHLHFEISVDATKIDPVPFLAAHTGATLVADRGLILGTVVVAPDGSLPDPLTPEDDVQLTDIAFSGTRKNPTTGEDETFTMTVGEALARARYLDADVSETLAEVRAIEDRTTRYLDAKSSETLGIVRQVLAAAGAADVDEQALAAALAPLLEAPLAAALATQNVAAAEDVAKATVAEFAAALSKGTQG